MSIWTERMMYTDSADQKVVIKPCEEMINIVLEVSDNDGKDPYRLYLNNTEAHKLAELLIEHATEHSK